MVGWFVVVVFDFDLFGGLFGLVTLVVLLVLLGFGLVGLYVVGWLVCFICLLLMFCSCVLLVLCARLFWLLQCCEVGCCYGFGCCYAVFVFDACGWVVLLF